MTAKGSNTENLLLTSLCTFLSHIESIGFTAPLFLAPSALSKVPYRVVRRSAGRARHSSAPTQLSEHGPLP